MANSTNSQKTTMPLRSGANNSAKSNMSPISHGMGQAASPENKKSPRIVQDKSRSRAPISTSPSDFLPSSGKGITITEKLTHTVPHVQQPSSSSSPLSSTYFPQSESSKTAQATPVKASEKQAEKPANVLAKFLVDDRLRDNISTDALHKARHLDSSFHIEKIPNVLKHLTLGNGQNYIPSKKLLEKYFSKVITQSPVWKEIEHIYGGFLKTQAGSIEPIGRDQQEAYGKCMVGLLFGESGTFEKSSLPIELRNFLISSDHYFHENLLENKNARAMSLADIEKARFVYFNDLLASKILLPLFSKFSASEFSSAETLLQVAIQDQLDHAIASVKKDFFAASYEVASPELKEKIFSNLVNDMQEQQEKLVTKRTQQLHLGSVSHSQQAKESSSVSPRSKKTIDELRSRRAKAKAIDKKITQLVRIIGKKGLSDNLIDYLHDENKSLLLSKERVSQTEIRNHCLLIAAKYLSSHSLEHSEHAAVCEFIGKLTAFISAEDQSANKALDAIDATVTDLEIDLLLADSDANGEPLVPLRSRPLDESGSASENEEHSASVTSVLSSGETTANSSTSSTASVSSTTTTSFNQ